MWVESSADGVHVDDSVGQVRDVVEKLVLGRLGYGMRIRHRQRPVHTEADLGPQAVSHPPCSDLSHSHNSVDCRHRFSDPSDDGRINRIEETLADTPSRLIADDEDGGGDNKADRCIRPLGAERHKNGADEYQQRSHAVRRA